MEEVPLLRFTSESGILTETLPVEAASRTSHAVSHVQAAALGARQAQGVAPGQPGGPRPATSPSRGGGG